MGQITATRNLVATKVVRHAGQQGSFNNDIVQTRLYRYASPSPKE